MPVEIKHAVDVVISVRKRDGNPLSLQEMAWLSDYVDGIEVREKIEEELVVDLLQVNATGEFYIRVIPKKFVTYYRVADFVEKIIEGLYKNEALSGARVEKLIYRPAVAGKPSTVIGGPEDVEEELKRIKKKRMKNGKGYV
ncbi:MAG: hypothetical protein J7K08_05680 [Thermoplasmata archaeon]|nr:hypothetical protein [Thermoplasmata archaeon]RLF53817.1 MAG: hypothetical protein DRN28_06495 [Thermoplasmata archaeon]RLF72871.1 MAG: hypothetical protein DRN55_05225 [Thermoplasmata archaeon]HDD60340.1 hypothetical protein [Euryarchaeota archaeon]